MREYRGGGEGEFNAEEKDCEGFTVEMMLGQNLRASKGVCHADN